MYVWYFCFLYVCVPSRVQVQVQVQLNQWDTQGSRLAGSTAPKLKSRQESRRSRLAQVRQNISSSRADNVQWPPSYIVSAWRSAQSDNIRRPRLRGTGILNRILKYCKFIEPCLAVVTTGPCAWQVCCWGVGGFCAECCMRAFCFWQFLADLSRSWQIFGRAWQILAVSLHELNGRVGARFCNARFKRRC